MFAITPVALAWLLYGGAAVVLAALLPRTVRVTPGIVGLGILLAQQAVATAAAFALFTTTSPAVAESAFRLGAYVWLLWGPAVALATALLLHHTPARRLAWPAMGVLGGLPLVFLLASLARPALLFAPGGGALTMMAVLLSLSVFVTFAASVALFAAQAFSTPMPLLRAQCALLAAAFGVEGAFHGGEHLAKILLGLDFHGLGVPPPAVVAVAVAPALVFLPVLVLVLRTALRGPAVSRWWALLVAGALAASLLTGSLVASFRPGDGYHHPMGAFHALLDLAALALIVFAGARFQLFSAEVHAKRGLAVSAAVLVGFTAFILIEAVVEQFIQDRYFAGLPAANVLSAALVALMSGQIVKLGRFAAGRLMPHVQLTKSYVAKRHEDIYRAALEGTLHDHHVTPAEAQSLRRLREKLGLSITDHHRLERQVRETFIAGVGG